MALRFKRNQSQKTATLKLTGFFRCVASNVLERQAPEYFQAFGLQEIFSEWTNTCFIR